MSDVATHAPGTHAEHHEELAFWRKYIFSVDLNPCGEALECTAPSGKK